MGDRVRLKASGNAGNGLTRFSVWKQSIAPGAASPPHRHACEEVIVVQAGHGRRLRGGTKHSFGPDTALIVLPGVPHPLFNVGDDAPEIIAVLGMTPVEVVFPGGEPLSLRSAS
jgi:quercetin dioxygenase-like cupin family protein